MLTFKNKIFYKQGRSDEKLSAWPHRCSNTNVFVCAVITYMIHVLLLCTICKKKLTCRESRISAWLQLDSTLWGHRNGVHNGTGTLGGGGRKYSEQSGSRVREWSENNVDHKMGWFTGCIICGTFTNLLPRTKQSSQGTDWQNCWKKKNKEKKTIQSSHWDLSCNKNGHFCWNYVYTTQLQMAMWREPRGISDRKSSQAHTASVLVHF